MAENDWTSTEVGLIVADYFSMLIDELNGVPINKTEHRNRLRPILNGRSDGSIEFKHQNISAVLVKLGLPFIKGYKPRWRFQNLLEEEVIKYISYKKPILESKFQMFSEGSTVGKVNPDFGLLDVEPPERSEVKEFAPSYSRGPFKTNYLKKEQENGKLGQQGEELARKFEIWRLQHLGLDRYVKHVKMISTTDDSAGFDILSKNENGSDRYIEVKTTKLSIDTPIFFSKNEYEFSLRNRTSYHLYRVFDFSDSPRLFRLTGSFDDFCQKEAVQYEGNF